MVKYIKLISTSPASLLSFVVAFLLSVVLFSCKQSHHQTKNTCEALKEISLTELADTNHLPQYIIDSLIEQVNFNIANSSPEMFDILIGLKGQKGTSKVFVCEQDTFCLGYDFFFTSFFERKTHISIELAAIYYINAIYYGEYFFASDRILYDSNQVVTDTFSKKLIPAFYQPAGRFEPVPQNLIDEAWKSILAWRISNQDLNLKEIRKGPRPLQTSSLFFVGEKGGNVNRSFDFENKQFENINEWW